MLGAEADEPDIVLAEHLADVHGAALATPSPRRSAMVIGHGDRPGLNIAAHLARRSVTVEMRNAVGAGCPIARVLLEVARAPGGDLLAMGACAHSRLREMVFGGATRDVFAAAQVPVLMAHWRVSPGRAPSRHRPTRRI